MNVGDRLRLTIERPAAGGRMIARHEGAIVFVAGTIPGEVVVARRGDRLVTHRLVELREGMAITKGDACSSVDPPVPIGALLGRVVAARRGANRFPGYRLVRRLMQRISTACRGGRNGRA